MAAWEPRDTASLCVPSLVTIVISKSVVAVWRTWQPLRCGVEKFEWSGSSNSYDNNNDYVILISCIETTIINERKIMMIITIILIMIMKSVITKLMKVIKRSRIGRKI